MTHRIKVDPDRYAKRWVSYIDLLGFSELIRAKGWIYVFSYYTQAIDHFIRDRGFQPEVDKTWFSDTFLLYTSDDTASSFASIEATTRWFIYFLLCAGIPLRGAMSCGDFYADKGNNVFFGEGLIEAYDYGENQDWIGFILSPSAVKQMSQVGLPADERLNYVYWNIPCKSTDERNPMYLPACILGGSVKINGRNSCLDKLREMKGRLKDNRHIRKYENAIRFIEANKRTLVSG